VIANLSLVPGFEVQVEGLPVVFTGGIELAEAERGDRESDPSAIAVETQSAEPLEILDRLLVTAQ
jgi:hypothetical protein